MAYEIRLHGSATSDMSSLRVYDQQRIGQEVATQLGHQPTVTTRNRKCLRGFVPSFEHVPPIWELRVGEFRVFYDVDEAAQVVNVRAVRRKAPGQKTEDIT